MRGSNCTEDDDDDDDVDDTNDEDEDEDETAPTTAKGLACCQCSAQSVFRAGNTVGERTAAPRFLVMTI